MCYAAQSSICHLSLQVITSRRVCGVDCWKDVLHHFDSIVCMTRDEKWVQKQVVMAVAASVDTSACSTTTPDYKNGVERRSSPGPLLGIFPAALCTSVTLTADRNFVHKKGGCDIFFMYHFSWFPITVLSYPSKNLWDWDYWMLSDI